MFTTLTIAAAWFSFGYSITDFLMTVVSAHRSGKYDE